jgi:N-acetyl-anhydromuramyl-L-alanine amidase AmpD
VDSVFWHWTDDGGAKHIAIAFVIAKDGVVYRFFEPGFWAYHIGKGSSGEHNRRSIGIELVNEGALDQISKNGEPRYYYCGGAARFQGEVHQLPAPWRGYRHFAKYPEAQIQAAAELSRLLCAQFFIPLRFAAPMHYNRSFLDFGGIVYHHNLREDKTDPSPAFDYALFQSRVLQRDD